jgi:hypothetical protein
MFRLTHIVCEGPGEFDDALIDAPEERCQFFIASDLVLPGGFVGAYHVADPVEAADNGNKAVYFRLVDPASIGERLAARRFQAVYQHSRRSADPFADIRGRRTPDLPAFLRGFPDKDVQRTLRGIGKQRERRLRALGKRAQRRALRERQIPFHANPV